MGVRSATINSTNIDDWAAIERQLAADELDLLCISPERLNNPRFVRDVLPGLAAGLGLLVIDEAHCISDWGHDFRPDYRRIRDAIANLPDGTPVVATTATANERVMADVVEQLGVDTLVLRGTLDRESLHLGVARLDGVASRLAWVVQRVRAVDGTGIVYCLTVEQTEQVAAFLQEHGIDAAAYSGRTDPELRHELEARFKANDLKALVATSALGMGVDKPDVSFVYHLGAPPSPIAYYQQVGRAGRSVPAAEAWLLPGPEDRAIWSWFTAVGLPSETLTNAVLDHIGDEPVTVADLERSVDLRRTRLEALLKILDVDGAIERADKGWVRTAKPWRYDRERVARVQQARDDEAAQMVAYADEQGCLLRFLRERLDDPEAADCGRCTSCRGAGDPVELDAELVRSAVEFLRGVEVPLEPRKQWARGADGPRGNIPAAERAEEGRALCRSGDEGWWPLVARALHAGAPDDELIAGVLRTLKRWPWQQRPTWATALPGTRLAPEVAARVAAAGKIEHHDVLRQVRASNAAASGNSAFRLNDVWGSLAVDSVPALDGPVLLVADRYDTGWTMTVAAHLLRGAGSGPVLPFALVRA
jgi:ATP-dependent DNA helicase RecQ